MAKNLHDWLATDVRRVRRRPLRWLSEQYFFRDPLRPTYVDPAYFFAPADGIILYQRRLDPNEKLVEIKGRDYTLRDALRNDRFGVACLVIGLFMTLYDVHVNRMPFAGNLCHQSLPSIDSCNRPMLDIEKALLHGRVRGLGDAEYLFSNQRVVSTVYASMLGMTYYMLQIADYDVASILPFDQRQHRYYGQNQRFSQVRFGSQFDLIIPLSPRWRFDPLLPDTTHVEAGLDPIIRITPNEETGCHE